MLKLFLAAMVASSGAGCATHADISNLQSQIDGLKASATQVSAAASSIKKTVNKKTVKQANTIARLSEELQGAIGDIFNPGHPMCNNDCSGRMDIIFINAINRMHSVNQRIRDNKTQ